MSYRVVCGYPGEFSVETDEKLRQIIGTILGSDNAHMFPEDDRFDDEVLNIIVCTGEAQALALKQTLLHAGIAGLNARVENTEPEIES